LQALVPVTAAEFKPGDRLRKFRAMLPRIPAGFWRRGGWHIGGLS
jgi:hypothetical protein